jgi:hypothetical protein
MDIQGALYSPENPTELTSYSTFNNELINECSGIAKSKQFDDLYWVHNDSGDDPRIFAVNANGELYVPEWMDDYKGLNIADAQNIDWEDITIDEQNRIIIGACGNNGNARKDLALYFIEEPNPFGVYATRAIKRVDFHYPDQTEFPPKKNNFDCEAIFVFQGKVHLLSKHRADAYTKLYRLESEETGVSHALTQLGTFPIQGAVTAADLSQDGTRLAVLTYGGITIFELEKDQHFFEGNIRYLPIRAKQCEAVCFENNETIIITNEQMELFRLAIKDIPEIKQNKE